MKENIKPYLYADVAQGSTEWLDLRYDSVTATDVPVILNLSKYETWAELLERKLKRTEREVNEYQKAAFARGHEVEPVLRERVEADLGIKLNPAVVISTKCPELLASLDGFCDQNNVIFEAKSLSKVDFASLVKKKTLKKDHFAQVQAQLLATGARKCFYFAMSPEDNAFGVTVLPDLMMHEQITHAVSAFMSTLKKSKELK